jgi:hypothetical protein
MLPLEALFATYPDALVVQTHRDPLEILPSAAGLTMVLRSVFSDFVDPAAFGNDMTKYWEDALDKFFGARKRLPNSAFLDVEYSDLVHDPMGVIRSLYGRLGRDLSGDVELRMHAFLAARPNGKHGNHSYTLAAFGMDRVKLSERLAPTALALTLKGYWTRSDVAYLRLR